jgi:hypothetical protein
MMAYHLDKDSMDPAIVKNHWEIVKTALKDTKEFQPCASTGSTISDSSGTCGYNIEE